MVRVLLLDNCKVNGRGIKKTLNKEFTFKVDYSVCKKELSNCIPQQRYDIYLINITVINKVGLGLVSKINNKHTNAKVFILITDDTYDIGICFNDFIETGVSGFISKTHSRKQFIYAIRFATEGLVIIPTDLLGKLRKVDRKIKVEGKSKLITNKERKILLLAAKGMTNREISEKIHMSQRNVERYLTKIYNKMEVHSRFEAIALGKQIGLIPKFLLVDEWKENFLSLDRAETD